MRVQTNPIVVLCNFNEAWWPAWALYYNFPLFGVHVMFVSLPTLSGKRFPLAAAEPAGYAWFHLVRKLLWRSGNIWLLMWRLDSIYLLESLLPVHSLRSLYERLWLDPEWWKLTSALVGIIKRPAMWLRGALIQGIWLGCLLGAFLWSFSRHIRPVGDPETPSGWGAPGIPHGGRGRAMSGWPLSGPWLRFY